MEKAKFVLVMSTAGRWEDKTDEIVEYTPEPGRGRISVRYKSSPERVFQYGERRVRILTEAETLNPDRMQLRIGGRLLPGVDAIFKAGDFYIVKAGEKSTPYQTSEIQLERDLAVDPACRSALDYFRTVAELAGAKGGEDESLLAGQYKYLTRVPDVSVLGAYLSPGSALKEQAELDLLVYPFGTNASQKAAVEKATQSQVTVVQGPPGTGKTQTILNIIANAICLGWTVAVVSNNNAATKNVADKLEARGLGFLLARLGKRDNKTAFIDLQNGQYPDWLPEASRSAEEMASLERDIRSLTTTLDALVQANNDRAILSARIAEIGKEADLHGQHADESLSPVLGPVVKRWKSADLLDLLVECEEFDPDLHPSLFDRIREVFRYGFQGRKIRRELLAAGPLLLRGLYYEKYASEQQEALRRIEKILSENDFQHVQAQVEEKSWELLCAKIAGRFVRKEKREKFCGSDFWSRYEAFQREYPVVLSTTHSIKTSLSPDCLYDLVIVDEASQVDVATGVLALACARRAVIVGDEKQLPNVIDDVTRHRAAEVWSTYGLSCPAWDYGRHSLLSSVSTLWPDVPNVLLREHYRCHPMIAGFFNRMFYDDRLIVMTEEKNEKDVMQVVFTVPGHHARGRFNQRQVDVIKQDVLPAIRRQGVSDIGIIAPYRDQVALLRHALGDDPEIDTVHGFQGREKQAIVISTVDNEIGEFVDDAQLLNVAVSRAKRSLTVVMADGQDDFRTNFGHLIRYIRRQQQSVRHSRIRSVFDLLYPNYIEARRRFLDRHGRTSEWDSESLAEAVVQNVLKRPEFARTGLQCLRHAPLAWLIDDVSSLSGREREYANHPWSHVDLLIYDFIGKQPLVGIEIDGWAFHRPGSLQSERDEVKNAIFHHARLPLVRLSTTGSGEAERITCALRAAMKTSRGSDAGS